jgi:hypothetical protein
MEESKKAGLVEILIILLAGGMFLSNELTLLNILGFIVIIFGSGYLCFELQNKLKN